MITLSIACFSGEATADIGTLRNFTIGSHLPSFTLPTTSGNVEQIAPGGGKPGVIMFFSLRPEFRKKRSLALLKSLGDLSAKYKNKIDITAIYEDKNGMDVVEEFVNSSNIKVMVLNDSDREVYNLYGVFMMPMIIMNDPDGNLHEVIPYTFNIRNVVEGNIKLLLGEWSAAELSASLKPHSRVIKSPEEKEYIRRINYGKIMLEKKMYPQAIREFSNATKLLPKDIKAHIELGYAFIAAKKFAKAQEVFQNALAIDPDSDDAISGLGLAYYGQGKIDKALSKLESAFITIKPRLEVIIALADIYEKKGNNERANRLNKLAVDRLMKLYEQRWK